MKKINLIAAIDDYNGLGHSNELLFHISEDLRRFKELTKNGIVIMGRKTLESLPNKQPLSYRKNIIITRDDTFKVNLKDTFVGDSIIVDSVDSAIIEACKNSKYNDNIFVIGGGEIYKAFLEAEYIDKIYLTKIFSKRDADTFLPDISAYGFKLIDTSKIVYDWDSNSMYRFETYQKEE